MNSILKDILIALAVLIPAYWFGRKQLNPIFICFPEDLHDTFFNQGYLRLENCHKHYRWSAVIVFTIISVCLFGAIAQIQNIGAFWITVLGGFLAFTINAIREARKQIKGGKDSSGRNNIPFSWLDIRFGTYAGFHFAFVAAMVFKLVTNL